MAEHFPHHTDKAQGARVADAVVDAVGILAGRQYAFVTQYRQVLGNIALRCTYVLYNVLHADFLITQGAKDLQT